MRPNQYSNSPILDQLGQTLYRAVAVPQEFQADLRMKDEYIQRAKARMRERPGKRIPLDERETVQWIKNEVDKRRIERLYFELAWMLNMAFVEGQQYMYINNYINSLFSMPSRYEWQQRDVYNQIAPIYETTMAKYSRINPSFQTIPQSESMDDINASKITKEVMDYWRESTEFESRQMEANSWSALTGTCIWKTIWNPSKGKKIGQIAKVDKYGVDYVEFIREGEVENVVCPPFEILPDSSYNYTMDDCSNIIHQTVITADEAWERYGVDIDGRTLNVFTFDKDYQSVQATNPYSGNSSFYIDRKRRAESTMLYEYYENPSKFYPEGRLIIVIDGCDKLIHDGPLPFINSKYGERRLPFDIQKDIPRAGYFWGTCRLDRAIPVQRRYNAIKNRIAEFMNRTAIGVWAIPAASDKLSEYEEYGIGPGEILDYTDPSMVPSQINSSSLPSTFENEAGNTLADLSRITGVSELSKDSTSSDVTSGRALLVLQEQDDTKMGLTAKSVSNCQLRVAKKTAYAFKQFASYERMISISGVGDVAQVIKWKGSSLDPETLYFKSVTALSDSLAQKRGFILDMMNAGAFRKEDGTIDEQRIFTMTEVGDTDVDQTPEEQEKKRSKRENLYIQMGAWDRVTINEWEIHEIAYKYHLEFMLSAEYEQLDKETQTAFEAHLQAHMAVLQQRAMTQRSETNEKTK